MLRVKALPLEQAGYAGCEVPIYFITTCFGMLTGAGGRLRITELPDFVGHVLGSELENHLRGLTRSMHRGHLGRPSMRIQTPGLHTYSVHVASAVRWSFCTAEPGVECAQATATCEGIGRRMLVDCMYFDGIGVMMDDDDEYEAVDDV